jgi:Beta propeller domain
MRRVLVSAISALLLVLGFSGCASDAEVKVVASEPSSPSTPPKTMQAFRSESELASYLREMAQRHTAALRATAYFATANAPMAAKSEALGSIAADAKDDSITNVQHAGVDEGGIVKAHGNYLVVLRRGRLFTVSIADHDLKPVSSCDAFGPDMDPRSTWYDEMLISKDTIVVIGYSYERGGTEAGLFHIGDDGRLTYRSTYQLRSNDYYSSRNYASRLIGNKLIFYSPLYMNPGTQDPFQGFPAVRKWHKGATPGEFRRIVAATQVYKPAYPIDANDSETMHTVTSCDLAGGEFDCKATSVIGPAGRVFYVSPNAVYIWVTSWAYEPKPRTRSMLYRMPLDGSAPSALKVSGSPMDQFSFLESEDGYLNVLVRSEGAGDGMWQSENAAGGVALMRVSVDSFSDGGADVPTTSYRRLPTPKGYAFQNRFVGEYLLYGTGSGWWAAPKAARSPLYVVRWATGDLHQLAMDHGTDRIEAMGSDAVVVGSDGKDLHFTAVSLGDVPAAADDYVEKGASQGELRSHGFFYKAEAEDSGMLGLPISVPVRPGYRHLFETSAAIVFLKNDGLQFRELGQLGAQPENAKDDGCRASCVDWYGNSQPLFLRGRIIALLGYEMVEGAVERGQIRETRRVNYASGLVVSQR